MTTFHSSSLLRRTAAAIAAVAGLQVAADSQAAQITLSSGTATCTFGQMLVTPSGDLSVQCTNTAPPVASNGGTFRLSATSAMVPVSTSGTLGVVREVGNTGAVNVSYTVAPSATTASCTPGSGVISFANGSYVASGSIPIQATAVEGTCTVSIGNPSTSDTPDTMPSLITAQSTATVTVAPANTCPTPPTDMLTSTIGVVNGRERVTANSGQIVAFPLPTPPIPRNSGLIRIIRDSVTPNAVILEGSISRCPGVIEANAGACYVHMLVPTAGLLTWFKGPVGGWDAARMATQNFCQTAQTAAGAGQWYFNARWTYPALRDGGWVFQYAYGSY